MRIFCLANEKREYPKVYTLGTEAPLNEFITVHMGRSKYTLLVTKRTALGYAREMPRSFRRIPLSSLLENRVMSGCIVHSFEEEIALLMELIIQLVMEGYLNQSEVERRYDKLQKLVAMATGNGNHNEQQIAARRALQFAEAILNEAKENA